MELAPYLENLRRELAVTAAAGGPEAREVAELLLAALEPALRLTLLNALAEATDEISRDLAPGSVHVRLQSSEPAFVVTPAPAEPAEPGAADDTPAAPLHAEEGATARINLRLPEPLKLRVEAAAGAEGLSVNTWLVRAVGAAVASPGAAARATARHKGQSFSGWVR